jgi:hypothetical protein
MIQTARRCGGRGRSEALTAERPLHLAVAGAVDVGDLAPLPIRALTRDWFRRGTAYRNVAASLVKREVARWSTIIKAANVRASEPFAMRQLAVANQTMGHTQP